MARRHNTRDIDRTLAHALYQMRVLRQAIQQEKVRVRVPQRSRVPGTNSYRRMSTGDLAVAALAGAAIYNWSQREQDVFASELDERNFTSASAVFNGQEPEADLTASPEAVDTSRFDYLIDHTRVITPQSLEALADSIDEVVLGNDGRVSGSLTPAEVLEDMDEMGMDPEAVDAYAVGVGASDFSLSDAMAASSGQASTNVQEVASAYEQTSDNAATL